MSEATADPEAGPEVVAPRLDRWTVARLVWALSVGPTVWMVHLAGTSALVPAACEHDISWSINLATVLTALLCATGVPAAWGLHRRDGGVGFLAWLGLVSTVASVVLILAEGTPNLVIGPCP